MSLSDVKTFVPMIAYRDMKCYKVCFMKPDDESIYSLFKEHKYELGKKVESPLADRPNWFTITEGLHSFMSENRAYHYLKLLKGKSGCKGVLVECIIPEGSRYYEGNFYRDIRNQDRYNGMKSYASDQIIPKRVIKA